MPNYVVTRSESVVNTMAYFVTADTMEDAIDAVEMGDFNDCVTLETDYISDEVVSVSLDEEYEAG
jgi:hypothetical protein